MPGTFVRTMAYSVEEAATLQGIVNFAGAIGGQDDEGGAFGLHGAYFRNTNLKVR